MDFTYYAVGLIALIVGFIASLVFVFREGRSIPRLLAIGFGISMLLSGTLLINWSRLLDVPGFVIVGDLVFFTIYSLVGCAVGAAPALIARSVWRIARGLVRRGRISN